MPMRVAGYAEEPDRNGKESVAGGQGSSQERGSMGPMEYVVAMEPRLGLYRILGHSKASTDALKSYHQGTRTGDGIVGYYTQRLGSRKLAPRSAINIIVTPSHWITGVNVKVDRATGHGPTVDLSQALQRHYAFAPPSKEW